MMTSHVPSRASFDYSNIFIQLYIGVSTSTQYAVSTYLTSNKLAEQDHFDV